jgi:hypothetical protein
MLLFRPQNRIAGYGYLRGIERICSTAGNTWTFRSSRYLIWQGVPQGRISLSLQFWLMSLPKDAGCLLIPPSGSHSSYHNNRIEIFRPFFPSAAHYSNSSASFSFNKRPIREERKSLRYRLCTLLCQCAAGGKWVFYSGLTVP